MFMDDPELIAEFVTESTESLADIENQLLAIEADGAEINLDLVNMVFRGIHSIKGVAGFLGLTTINELSHCLEDVLNRIRNQELIPTTEIVDVMLQAADELNELVSAPEASNTIDVSRHLQNLNAYMTESTRSATFPEVAAEDVRTDTVIETAVDEAVGAAEQSAESLGIDDHFNPELESTTEIPDRHEVDGIASKSRPELASESGKEPKSAPAKSSERATSVETSIRVPISTLDQLMNLAGELVLNRNRLLQYSSDKSDSEFVTLSSDIDRNTCELQEAIMQTRMQPIGTAFSRFPRIIRDLSSKLGKECNLIVEGKDVEVDKSIIEAVGDPLTHLIRNSIDHGIERPDERLQAGKDPDGTIRLSAYHRAGQVCIDIEDDGRGIDPHRLKTKAVSKGLISERQASEMSIREALRLVFHPGFSTADKLTDVSGRGVGMDVVRTNMERIGGTVDIESQVGQGTTIKIVLPLTLAIIRSLIVSSHDRPFVIPQVNVAELVRLSEKERDSRIGHINQAVVLHLRDELIPLIDLTKALGLAPETGETPDAPRQALNIVILETGRSRYGAIVDHLHDSEEIVVKPLGMHLKNCQSFAGATILGDGRVALILDVSGIAAKMGLTDIDEASLGNIQLKTQASQNRLPLLIFRNAPEERFAIPMTEVARIERVETDRIEQFNGRLITQYRGGTLPLVAIESVISASSPPPASIVSVVVFSSQGREFGVIAPEIEDIHEVSISVDTESLSEPGVIGSQVIGGITTRILDVYRIFEACYPRTRSENASSADARQRPPSTILVAEDSEFFRKRVVAYLQEAHYEVIEACDGVDAWETLERERDRISVMLTDIEMPNMDGFTLCRKVREDGRFDDLPIIALTSLGDEESISNGKRCGVTEYQVKMDRESLLNSVQRLAKAR